jgi:hypothetical protein
MIDLENIFVLLVLLLIGWYWLKAREIKEIALIGVRNYCEKLDVELLDETVVLRGLSFKRDNSGKMRHWRLYAFEFSSDGDSRYKGRVTMLGGKVESIWLDTHRLH